MTLATLTLPDGRRVDVESTGPDDGFPLVFHHGMPGSRVQFQAMRRAAHERGIRLITFSRSGYGNSTRQPGRRLVAAAPDTAGLLDGLGIDRCWVAGWSGGGPHALAAAAKLPDRVAAVLVIAGVGPFDAPDLDFYAGMGEQNAQDFALVLRGEAAIRPSHVAEAAELLRGDAATITERLRSLLPEVDRALCTGELGEDLAASFAEGLRTGVDGWVDDELELVRPWGFDLDEITVPSFVWHGSEDLMVPFGHGEWLAKHIPGVAAHLMHGEGHFSIGIGAIGQMLDELGKVR